jgi:hypothetical protein
VKRTHSEASFKVEKFYIKPLVGALPDPAPMQSLASPLEVFEAGIRELEVMFADLSSVDIRERE